MGVARGSGADVCDNSGPFNRERVALRHDGHVSVPFRHASGGAAYSPKGVGCMVWPAERL